MRVTVDGTAAGVCPLDSIPLNPGVHVVQGWPADGRRFTATPLSRRVEVLSGTLILVDLSSIRRVRIESEPYGALVTREGTPLGSTPVTISVSPDDPPCLVEMEGFEPISLSAQSLLDGPSPRRIALEPLPGVPPTSLLARRGPSRLSESSLTTYLTGMTCIGAITAAVVLKEAADSEYDEYLVTGDVSEMDAHLRRAQRLDSWALASWIVGEVALGLLVYELLRDRDRDEPIKEAE